jgi:CubicO group peptidase (beta-lactamase class C family)
MHAPRFGRHIAAVAICVASATPVPGQPSIGTDVIVRGELGARADSFLTRAAMYGLSGSVVVARRGEIVLQKGYGIADRERAATIGVETPFFIGSLAKQFTAAAVLRLAADGRLRLSDSLGAFFPDVPPDKRGITLRQLLSHTGGLPYLPSAGLFGAGTRDSVMREMLSEPLEFEPGSRYGYSTPGYILLAGVIEHASGETYEQYMRSLFDRAHLTSTGFVGDHARWLSSPVRSYSDDRAEESLADLPPLPRFVGAGSIISTAHDLYLWYSALQRGDILPNAQRDELFAPVVRTGSNVRGALAWLLVDLPSGTLRQAAGDIGGFNAELRDYVDEGLVVAFASNGRVRGRGYREIVMNTVARLSRGSAIPFPPAVEAMRESQLRSLPGIYSLPDSGAVDVWASGDSLMVGARNAAGIAMLAGHDSAATRRAAFLDARTAELVAALGAAGSEAERYVHPSIPSDARREYHERLRSLIADADSAHADVIGTAVDSPMTARTYLRERRANGDGVVTLVWAGDLLIGLEDSGRAAYPLRLRASGPDELVSFDLFSGHLVRVTAVADRELAIESNGVTRRVVR